MVRSRLSLCLGFLIVGSSGVWASASVIIMAADPALCSRLAAAWERDGLPAGRFRFVGAGVAPADWQPVTLAGVAPIPSACSLFEQVLIDLDGDGRLDRVIRSRFCMKGIPSDSLYLFPTDSEVLTRMTWQDLTPLHDTPDKFERTGGVYPLTQLPAEMGRTELRDVFSVELVTVDRRSYVVVSARPFEWLVVGRFQAGGRLQEKCYLKRAEPS